MNCEVLATRQLEDRLIDAAGGTFIIQISKGSNARVNITIYYLP